MSVPCIALVGPESTGKTTLALALAARLGAHVVPEVARTWLADLGRPYVRGDLVQIATAQREAEQRVRAEATREGAPCVLADTNLLVLQVWSEVRYGTVDPGILDHLGLDSYRLHLLLEPDLPWEPDPLREDPDRLPFLYARYEAHLLAAGVPWVSIRGHGDTRTRRAEAAVREALRRPD